ncbi:uncharacterized protein JCM15063_003526 [Sporobolomyces koalae]|uniref:uncharacterized protein n=1 Tax=Sporobolomyces koalae TaxID=500713 RepID=UPI003177BB77
MPSRHDLSPLPPSSSFTQSTPAFSQRPPYPRNASSSSPPNDVIATPSDRHDLARGSLKQARPSQRRSVRIRSSSGGQFDSSPQLGFAEPSAYLDEKPTVHMLSVAQDYASQKPRSRTAALDSASGTTPEHPDFAQQRVTRLLHTDATPSQQQQPYHLDATQRRQPIVRSYSSTGPFPSAVEPSHRNDRVAPAYSGSPHMPGQPLSSRTPTASSALQRATLEAAHVERDLGSATRTVRNRPSFEDVIQRSAKRQMRSNDLLSSQVMQWAQEDETSSSSSDDEDVGLASLLAAGAQSRRHAHSPATGSLQASASKLLPSPVNFDRLGGIHEQHQSPSLGQDSAPRRGIMDRFMSDRPGPGLTDQAPVLPQLPKEQIAPPHSPPRRTKYAPHLLASPVASKPSPSVLFSPDVAKLLRSELDQLEANENAGSRRPSSPLKTADRSSDIVVDSSPFRSGSPFSGGIQSRTHDVFGGELEYPAKRGRWTHVTSAKDNGLVSPTSSSTSGPMHAPSFCDSSPPSSDHGSNTTRPQTYALNHAAAHPVSAPDFLYGNAPPSSSPTSSQHSEYLPARFSRSSPGPTASEAGNLSRSGSVASVVVHPAPAQVSASARPPRRAPALRPEVRDYSIGQRDPDKKPSWSYAALIGQAILSTEDQKMSLADIYTFIMSSYPYYKKQDAGWQNSIRHNLSLNECFVKTARSPNKPGKGCLWAIVQGCEDQFADGGFFKRGAGSARKNRGKGSQQQGKEEPQTAPRTQSGVGTRRNRAPSPTGSVMSSRSDSVSTQGGRPQTATLLIPEIMPPPPRDYSPASISVRSATSASPPPQMPLSASVLEFNIPPPPMVPRPASAASVRQAAYGQSEPRFTMPNMSRSSITLARSYSTTDVVEAPVEAKLHYEHPMMVRTASAPVLAKPAPPVASAPPAKASAPASPSISRSTLAQLREPLLSATMSPPTSVYHRLAGPYQPMYGASSLQNRRALALLASPEAAGIMPAVHPFDRGQSLLTAASQGSPRAPAVAFLPSPQIFPGGPSRRLRTESEKDERGYAGLLSPSTLVHTQSPISSVRGGPRVPMSPTQPSVDKFEPIPDPEKKPRAMGTRLLPAVNALVDASHDPFRSPPRTTRTRSPSARTFASIAPLHAGLQTPGKRPLGFSPSLSGGNWASWNDPYSAALETELEHFNHRDSPGRSRSPWPSPGPRLGHW